MLVEGDTDDDVANDGENEELGGEQHEAGEDGGGEGHSAARCGVVIVGVDGWTVGSAIGGETAAGVCGLWGCVGQESMSTPGCNRHKLTDVLLSAVTVR